MSKEKTKKSTLWKNIVLLVALALALTAFCMIFFEMVVAVDGSASYRGNEVVFGYNKVVNYDPDSETVLLEAVWAFSFGNFTTYFSLTLAIICCVGAIAYKKQGLVLSVLTMLLFIAAGVGFLNQAGNLEPYTQAAREYYETQSLIDYTSSEITAKINEIILAARSAHKISWAAYVAASSCFVAAGAALISKIGWQALDKKGN